jgi:hypothetical protein
VAAPELYSDVVTIGDLEVHRIGLASKTDAGVEITGSAAESSRAPLGRAYFELLERAAVIRAEGLTCPMLSADGVAIGSFCPEPVVTTERSRPARSSGVALHQSWEEACLRARFELIERDRVLRSWYGELAPVPVPLPASLDGLATHEWCACSIPEASANVAQRVTVGRQAQRRAAPERKSDAVTSGATNTIDGEVEVAVIVGFPLQPGGSLARGFAARASLDEALEAAAAEALQGLAFLWEEPLPACVPEVSPTPTFHLDYYLWPAHHAHLRGWLSGGHVRGGPPPERSEEETRYADLTPPGFGTLRVARALRRDARPLVFGDAPASSAAGLPGSHIHPIP